MDNIPAAKRKYTDISIADQIRQYQQRYEQVLKRLKNKSVITVGFQVIHRSIWKYDRIYQLMDQDPFFNPVVFVCPYLREGKKQMLEEMNDTCELMESKGYETIKTYDERNDSWINIKEKVQPDIVFFSVPFDYTEDQYRIHHFTDSLSCYVPYFFTTNGKEGGNYDGPFHNLVWRNFYETDIHKRYAQKYARNNAENVVVSGYPQLDNFLYESADSVSDPWPFTDHKKIIWAPHHTIDGQGQGLNYSTFKQYHAVFKDMAREYADHIQIAFKPHPMLKEKLYKDEEWGKVRADHYYQFWDEVENGLLEQSDYTDLFLTSDALIHDCSSFMAEYLSTSKPALYLLHDDNVDSRLHEFGKMALDNHYHAKDTEDIHVFVKSQVLKGRDPMQKERLQFVGQHLKAGNGKPASKNIVNYIKMMIKG
ncbi:CDP-glycerol glycerophosphotransferase family protein [Aliifodinibius salicampi]|uniref:CDP-glycerol glycerophosphotransferase family protein n=1 Tax=Fodinibius salicampi TaxID=1920655 RepID=A0ABT3Q0E1_9BACT|nr:CDP-glycerol glycerophosphotransferase family protein [Fodinibius salicampi]MCW9713578.1 CDP-glycerol glycerophosphotransferase family protein [Fodinibius salicampi]